MTNKEIAEMFARRYFERRREYFAELFADCSVQEAEKMTDVIYTWSIEVWSVDVLCQLIAEPDMPDEFWTPDNVRAFSTVFAGAMDGFIFDEFIQPRFFK